MRYGFKTLLDFFKAQGFRVIVKKETYPRFAWVENDHLCGGFSEISENYHAKVSGKIALDCVDLFDKWSKCPLSLPLPKNKAQLDFLLNKINWLTTTEGYRISDEFDCVKWVDKYPEDL